MPNNIPVTMDSATLKERMNKAAEKTVVNVAFYSAFPERREEMQDIVKEGGKAFKLFMPEKIGGLDTSNYELMLKSFQETVKLNVPVSVHALSSTPLAS